MDSSLVKKFMNEAITNRTSVLIVYRKEESRTIISRRVNPYEIKTESRTRDKSRQTYIYAVDKTEPLKIKKFLVNNFISIKPTTEKYNPIF